MNGLIERIFKNYKIYPIVGKAIVGLDVIGGRLANIPIYYMYNENNEDTYIVYSQQDADNSLSGDDDLIGYVDYYDFDIYSKTNPRELIKLVKELLKENGFVWQPSRTSGDMYESETGFYHKTLNFAILREE